MNVIATAPVQRQRRHALDRASKIERALGRFPGGAGTRACALAARSPRFADLALSFPALLHALASPLGGVAAEAALRLVDAGAPLAVAAEAAGVPVWLRGLGPALCATTLPRLPDGPAWRRQVPNLLPTSPKCAAAWLADVAFAARWGGDDFGLWVARERRKERKRAPMETLQAMVLWHFFSGRPDLPAHALVERRFARDLGWTGADAAAQAFLQNLRVHVRFGDEPVGDPWHCEGTQAGFSFRPILDAEDLVATSRRLENCARTYAVHVARGDTRLWSVERDGALVAMLEVRRNRWNLPFISAMNGPRNAAVSRGLARAAEAWHRAAGLMTPASRRVSQDARLRARRRLLKPWWRDLGRIPDWCGLSYAEGDLFVG